LVPDGCATVALRDEFFDRMRATLEREAAEVKDRIDKKCARSDCVQQLAAAEAGKDMFSEKPVGSSIGEGRASGGGEERGVRSRVGHAGRVSSPRAGGAGGRGAGAGGRAGPRPGIKARLGAPV